MTVPVIYGDVRNPFNNKKSRSYKKTELIITAVLANSNSSKLSDVQTSKVSDSEVTDVHMLKQPEQQQQQQQQQRVVDVNARFQACYEAMNNFLSKTDLEKLADLDDCELCLCDVESLFSEARWKEVLKAANCQAGDLPFAFLKLMKDPEMREKFKVVAEKIDEYPHYCKVMSIEFRNLIAKYLNFERRMMIQNLLSQFKRMKEDNEILKKYPGLTILILTLFTDAVKSPSQDKVDRIQELLYRLDIALKEKSTISEDASTIEAPKAQLNSTPFSNLSGSVKKLSQMLRKKMATRLRDNIFGVLPVA